MRTLRLLVLAGAMAVAAVPAWGQAPVTAADIGRLETTAGEIGRQVETLRQTDPTLAGDVSARLAELTDEVTYLRVKLRREGAVTRDEYASLRDRLDTLLVRADDGRPASPTAGPAAGDGAPVSVVTVPVGTEFDVRLQTALHSGTAKVEQRFEATTLLDYTVDGAVVVPAGSVVRGFVSSVRPAGRIDRRGSLTLSFDELRLGNQSYRLRAVVTQAMDAKVNEDVARIGAGAAVGAILGGIFGGGRGALLGVLIGGGGTIAAVDGTDVDLPAGTVLRVRLDQAVDLARPAPDR